MHHESMTAGGSPLDDSSDMMVNISLRQKKQQYSGDTKRQMRAMLNPPPFCTSYTRSYVVDHAVACNVEQCTDRP
jgi:hypothetical protein